LVKKFVGLVSPYYTGGEVEAREIAHGWLEADQHADVAKLIETTWATAVPL
jgi:hypothetical protein